MRARDALGFGGHFAINKCRHRYRSRRYRFAYLLCPFLALLSIAADSQSAEPVHVVPRSLSAQGPLHPDDSGAAPRIRVDVDLVLVPATVTDRLNRPIIDLQQKDFAILEDDAQQRIRYFTTEDAPLSIGLIVDVSNSMSNKINAERAAIAEFFKDANPQDDYFVISLADRPHLIADTTQSLEEIEKKMALVTPAGHTALLDAIYLGLAKLRAARYQRKALLIISDGGDNHSHYTLKDIKGLVQESDVLVYAIGIFDALPLPGFKTLEEKLGQQLLTKVTAASGGRDVPAEKPEKLPGIAASISRELRQQYVIGYKSSNALHNGKWRKIKLEVTAAKGEAPLRAYYKAGYLSPEK
ncbi:MAG: VWA domain-containing protein [Acidobacteriaceae bacterium]|nr:VWA domain-containing protein [Acidobacteriaceae bacterium]